MITPFAEFAQVVRGLGPRTAVVFGSGLGGATEFFHESSNITFGHVPGLVPPTICGHAGRISVGLWYGVPTLVFLGRLHLYEGHANDIVKGPIRIAAELGIKRVLLTNTAGGIHPDLSSGDLMAIRAHIKLLGRDAWSESASGPAEVHAYSKQLLDDFREESTLSGRSLPTGVYAAVMGPCYETPAEIRALAACGADAVGMSTALEAETAAAYGLEVAAISCITNRAAGLGESTLNHLEVLDHANRAAERLTALLTRVIARQ